MKKVNLNQLRNIYVTDSGSVFLSWEDVKRGELNPSLTAVGDLEANSAIPSRGRVWVSGSVIQPHRGMFVGLKEFEGAQLIEVEVERGIG